jgi:hypothetical protein
MKNMNSGKEKVILLELSSSHQVTLYSQVLFLQKSGYEPLIWINEKLPFDDIVFQEKPEVTRFKYDNFRDRSSFTKELKKCIKQNNIRKIVLNTAQGMAVRNLILRFLFYKIDFVGVLHEAERLFKSTTQKIINLKVKKYFVLSDYILEYCREKNLNGIEVKPFYPIFTPHEIKSSAFLSNKLLICIPGEVSVDRKNYKFLIDILSENKDKLSKNIKFIFLGNPRNEEGRTILKQIINLKLEDIVQTYDDFISEKEFNEKIYESDLIMPLIDREIKYFEEYSNSKVTGAYILAFDYHKPLLMDESLKHIELFQRLAFFYNHENFIEVINSLEEKRPEIEEKRKYYDTFEKFSFEFQRINFISYLE